MAIRALGTDINIKRIVRIIYVSWLYRLTSFVQQLRRERQNKKVSKLVIIIYVKSNSG